MLHDGMELPLMEDMGFTLAPATHALIGVQTTEVGRSALPEYTFDQIHVSYPLSPQPWLPVVVLPLSLVSNYRPITFFELPKINNILISSLFTLKKTTLAVRYGCAGFAWTTIAKAIH